MAFSNIITAVMADLAEVQTGVASKIGARYIAKNADPPPRVVWTPQTENFGPTPNLGENPRQLLTCSTRFIVHIWGGDPGRTGDLAPTETLKNSLLASLYRVCHGYWPYETGVGTWASENGEVADSGALYLLEVTLQTPVVDRPLGEATVTAINQTDTARFPGGNIHNP